MSTQTIPTPTHNTEIICRDPGTGEELGRVPIFSPTEIANAVVRARSAQPAWASRSFKERGEIILKARELMLRQVDELAFLVSRETGKPVSEAIAMEVVPTLDAMYYLARNAAKLLRPQKIDIGQYGLMGRSSRIVYKPLGVVGIISP